MSHPRLTPDAIGPIVVKVGGRLLDEPAACAATFAAVAALHRDHPGGAILVHGGGVAVDRHLAKLGLESERREGIRITPPEIVEPIAAVLAGLVNKRLVGLLLAHGGGIAPVGIALGDGGTCRTRATRRYPFDAGRVGEIEGGDPTLLRSLLAEGFLPVVSSIGIDDDGGLLNVNADDAAAALCPIVGASGLVLLTDMPGVLGRDGVAIPELDAAACEALVADGTISGGMIPKVRAALETADAAGVPVTIASWTDPDALHRIAAGRPAGTRIRPALVARS